MIVAIVGLTGVIITALLTYLASRKTASSSELSTVMEESRAMRGELRAEAIALRDEADSMRLRLQKCEDLCDRMAKRLFEEGIVMT